VLGNPPWERIKLQEALFAETIDQIIGQRGRAGFIVPSGIATDDSTKRFFRQLVKGRRLVSLFGFDNAKRVFPAPFSLVTLGEREAVVELAHYILGSEELKFDERPMRDVDEAASEARRALLAAQADRDMDSVTIARARLALAKAHAARAEDARHGAGQISLSAQRAPTLDACDLGWRRAEAIAAAAEASALEARRVAEEIGGAASPTPVGRAARAARAAAERAEAAAREARRIIEERNDAYTFHADEGFSFGEGWHVAAAAVLAGVAVQIELGKPGTARAERFLRDAGLVDRLVPYRSRPRAMKQTTELVARAFMEDPIFAQRRLRAAFLGDEPVARPVSDYADRRLAGAPDGRKVLLWIRTSVHEPTRNTRSDELIELSRRARRAGLVPVLVGDAVPDGAPPEGAVDMTLHWRDPLFQGIDGRRAQLQLFEHLKRSHGVVGQIGVTTAGMDGPALMGLPTIYLTDAPNARMRRWVGAVPGYHEVVREGAWLDRIDATFSEWLFSAVPPKSAHA
jgi:hypothetical protein